MSSIYKESQQRPTEEEDSTHVQVHRLEWEAAHASTEALVETQAYLVEQQQIVAELSAVVENQRQRLVTMTLARDGHLAREKQMGDAYVVLAKYNKLLADRDRRCRCTLRKCKETS